MATSYQIQITMTQETIAQLKKSGFNLYAFKAVQNGNKDAAPLVWFKTQRDDLLTNTTINWSEQYQAFISNSQIISGGVVDGSNAADINLGQTANVDKDGNLDAVNNRERLFKSESIESAIPGYCILTATARPSFILPA